MAIISWMLVLILLAVSSASVTFPQNDSRFQYMGRVSLDATQALYAWPGVTVTAVVSGTTSVSVILADQFGNNRFNVIVDGVLKNYFKVTSTAKTTYSIVLTLTPGAHTISLSKATETYTGWTKFYGFVLDTGATLLAPPARSSRRIEFVGDSITVGYGANSTAPVGSCTSCSAGSSNTNNYFAHGSVTARAFGAEYMTSAWSGIGMFHNSGDTNQASAKPLPSFYNNTIGQIPSYGYWNFNSWIPQAIVINLGTNDYSGTARATDDQFKTAYLNFIATVRQYYSAAPPQIFLVCGPLIHTYCTTMQQVAAAAGGLIKTLSVPNDPNNYGCSCHPNIVGHKNIANLEIQLISSTLGWSTGI